MPSRTADDGRHGHGSCAIPACRRPRASTIPSNEQDSCGVGFIADMKNRKSHDIVEQGLAILHNLDHRGAVGADPKMGDGCGILVQIPHRFFAAECAKLGIWLPEEGQYGVGHLFMPRDPEGFAARRGDRHQGDRRRGPAGSRLARGAGRFQRSRREREGRPSRCTARSSSARARAWTTRRPSSAACSSPARSSRTPSTT